MELLSDHMAIDVNMNMDTQEIDEIELPIVETQPLQIIIETSGSWDVNASCPETSTSAHGGSAKRFGFRPGEEFACKVLIKTEFYVVLLNDRLITNSEHMVPVGSIHGLVIDGDSDIWNIAFGNPATLENFKIKDPSSPTIPEFETEECLSNHEDVFVTVNKTDQPNGVGLDKIKAVKSTSNLYEPDTEQELSSREMFALSEKTRKSSYQLVFDLDEEELGGKDKRDEDLSNELKISLINNAKSKSIQNLFHERPRSLGRPVNGLNNASQMNGHQIRDSMEDDELWSIDFDTLANGVPKDHEVDKLFSFVDRMAQEENGKSLVCHPDSPSAITENGNLKQTSHLRPLTFPQDKSQEPIEVSQPSGPQGGEGSPTPSQRKTPPSRIPRLDAKYFQSINQLDADTCRKKLHNNTVKALRSGRRIVNNKGTAGPRTLERSFSLPLRSKPGENMPTKPDDSRIPKSIQQQNSPTNSANGRPQKLVNGHSNGYHNSLGATGTLTKPSNNVPNGQPKVGAKRSSIASLPPINNLSPKKDQPPSPKTKTNSKTTSPSKDAPVRVNRTNATLNTKPHRVTDETKTDLHPNKVIDMQVDQVAETEGSIVQLNNTTEVIESTTPCTPNHVTGHLIPDTVPKFPNTNATSTSPVPTLDENTMDCVPALSNGTLDQSQDDRSNQEGPDKAMIWGSVKPRETANNHFSHPIQNPYTDVSQLSETTAQNINGNANLNSPIHINGHKEPVANGSNQQETQINDRVIKESASIQNYQSDSLKPNLTSSNSVYLYDLLKGSNLADTHDVQHDPASDTMQKSTTSLQPTVGKKDKSAKNFLQSPRKWLSRKLSMVKKPA